MNTSDTKHESDSTSTDSTTSDNEFESRTMRKVDWRLIPLFGLLSAVAIMDRANLGTAKLTGMDEALHTDIGSRYNIVTAVYFIPNLFCQVPSNLALRYIGVHNWLAFCVAAWGVIGLSAGFVTNWKQLALCRLLLGCFEAGLHPAIVLTITTWYKRHEVQQRLAAFQIVISFTASIGMMIGYGLSCLDGVLGKGGWSWLFILEGAITLVIGIVAWFFIPSFPDQNSFLTEEQTRWVLERIEKDRGDAEPDRIHFKKFLLILTDWKIWVYVIMHFCAIMPTLALAYFSNIILSAMGWSNAMSIFLANPPYLFGVDIDGPRGFLPGG
ncbi:hypothetical protein AX16_004003 [Volvariella volvacea WC 439]|nr:hypothetical protein AX16_004003 [Volvariella volvacea WC 439]